MKRAHPSFLVSLLGVCLSLWACSSINGIDDLSFTQGTCKTIADCETSKNECVVTECVEGTCAYRALDQVNLGAQVVGDCRVSRCRNGKAIIEPDDADVVTTATDCDEELCVDGQPSNLPRASNEACSTNGGVKCNGSGTCVECLVDSDCAESKNPCMQAICETQGHCAEHPKPEGTLLPLQTPSDCQVVVCDGTGSAVFDNENNDIKNDANDCTEDTCVMGVPTYTLLAEGTLCGYGLSCDVAGHCAGCIDDDQCKTPQTCGGAGKPNICGCTPISCDLKGCGIWPDGCGGFVICDNGTQDGDEKGIDCGADQCARCAVGTPCGTANDCLSGFCVDGVCCNEACTGTCRACSNAAKGLGKDGLCGPIGSGVPSPDDCTDVGGCGTTGACNGAGKCAKYENGTVCSAASCSGLHYTPAGTCLGGACNVGNPIDCVMTCTDSGCFSCESDAQCPVFSFCEAGACKPVQADGTPCMVGSACQSGACVDGVCCSSLCDGTCMACNVSGSVGTCAPVRAGNEDPGTCVAPNACDALAGCKLDTGQPCQKKDDCAEGNCVDGVCCDRACAGTCESCNLPGNQGSCTNVSAGESDPSSCAAPKTCNSNQACVVANGEKCGPGLSCASGHCVDGYCCDSACTDTCKACNLPLSLGFCVLIPSGLPDSTCAAGQLCDSLGQCKRAEGAVCASDALCLNDNCVDNVCCGSLCDGTCMACGTGGICGLVAPGGFDTDTCSIPMVCNGAGACINGLGAACGGSNECLSGHCVDGVCCNSACDGVCEACGNGLCSPVTNAADPDTCAAPKECDASAACKKPNGMVCAAAADCKTNFCVDGICCDTSCTGACKACDIAPDIGTCSDVVVGTPDTCPPSTTCNGYGACFKAIGQACSNAFDCQSGFCANGVCCSSACDGVCESCALPSSVGTCSLEPLGTQSDTCTGAFACDGFGQCKWQNSHPCTLSTECASSFCVDGVCCNNACSGVCKECNRPGSVGTCANVPFGQQDPGTCDGFLFLCDGNGTCF